MLLGIILFAAQLCRFNNYPQCFLELKNNELETEAGLINQSFWLKEFDFSSVSPWNSHGGCQRAGTAISKRHIIFSYHFPLKNRTRILFVGQDGKICACCIEKTKRVGKTDIMIGSLDYELTPNIIPAKVMPSDWSINFAGSTNLPVLTFNQSEKLLYSELSVSTSGSPPGIWNHRVNTFKPIIKGRCRNYLVPELVLQKKGMIRRGDSGNPAFLIFKGEPVLLYCLLSGGYGIGQSIHQYLLEIQKVMDELHPGYQLTIVE